MKALVISLAACLSFSLMASEWQWSVPVVSVTSDETKEPPRAFLWIPPTCQHVRAVVVGQHNMLEEPLFENQTFRTALAELGIAEVWISPILGGQSRFGEHERATFGEMFRLLAAGISTRMTHWPRFSVFTCGVRCRRGWMRNRGRLSRLIR